MDNTIHSDLIRGHINTIILKALYDGDRYGFDIIKEIEQKSSGQYILKQPTLYSCLKRLEVQGFIKSYWGAKSNGGRRKYYTLTDMGKDLFIKNQTEWEYSRTVIDKLISDKDFDFSSVTANTDNVQENENTEISNDRDDENVDLEREFNDDSAAEETPYVPFPDNGEIINGESYAKGGFQEELSSPLSQDAVPQDLQQQVVRHEYLDTTAIMNELFEQQMRNGESYTEKLKNEQYIPAEMPSADSYFNNDYLQEADTEYATTPAYDTDDILNNFDVAKKEASYVPPLYVPATSETSDTPVNFESRLSANKDVTESPEQAVKAPEFYSYSSAAPDIDEKTLVINREYKNILSELRNKNATATKSQPQLVINEPAATTTNTKIQSSSTSLMEKEKLAIEENYNESDPELLESEASAVEDVAVLSNDKLQTRNFKKLTSDVKDLGDGIKIRTHNSNVAKEYASTYYFYSNKLMLSHYLILFVMMLLEITITFIAVKIGCPTPQKNDLLFYILAVVISLAFPVVAFILNLRNPEKQKRVSFNFRISVIFRLIVMLQAFILIYTVNLIMGMRLTFDAAYLTTLLIPAIMCTNIPISTMIFQSLYKSNKYCVEN